MKRIILISSLLLFTSCNYVTFTMPSYSELVKTFTFWPDFTNGKVLLYDLNAPADVQIELYEEVTKDFKKLLGDRFSVVNDTDNLIEMGINNFTKEKLAELKKQTGVDYLMIINAADSPYEYFRQVTPNEDPFKDGYYNEKITSKKITYFDLAILDLNQEKLIYHRAVKATLSSDEEKLINLKTTSKKMILKSYRKLFKQLKKRAK